MAGKVIVRAGTVSSLIEKIKEDPDQLASGISVNQSKKEYKTLAESLATLTRTGGVFTSSRYVAVGWKKDIEIAGGDFRNDALKDNAFHALMDNLAAKKVGGVFQEMNNPHYQRG